MELHFRPLTRADFPLLERWLSAPHVKEWWNEPLSLEGVETKYGPRVDGTEPTHLFVILAGGKPAGWIQWYRWSDYPAHARELGAPPESAGVDLALGEEELTGLGIGTRVLRDFLSEVVFLHPEITEVIADPEEANGRSVNAFKEAGFEPRRTVQLKSEAVRRVVVGRKRA